MDDSLKFSKSSKNSSFRWPLPVSVLALQVEAARNTGFPHHSAPIWGDCRMLKTAIAMTAVLGSCASVTSTAQAGDFWTQPNTARGFSVYSGSTYLSQSRGTLSGGFNSYQSSGNFLGRSTPNFSGGFNTYSPSGSFHRHSTSTFSGGSNFYNSSRHFVGRSTPNFSGGYNYLGNSGSYRGRSVRNFSGGYSIRRW